MTIEGFSLIEIALTILVLLLGAAVFKFAFTLDFVEWKKFRHERNEDRLRTLCTHTELGLDENGNPRVVSLFHSPSGTTSFICSRCGFVTHDRSLPEALARYFLLNPKVWANREKKFSRLAKRMYGV